MGARILVVDDDPPTRDVVAMVLADAGVLVDSVSSAAEAVGKLGAAVYDAIVTDYMMPGMSGLELVTLVREKWPSTRCVVLSGYDPPTGANARWLTKPIDVDALLDALGV
jgi:CheY-like chemotaxis protein